MMSWRARRSAGSIAIYAGYIVVGLVFLFPLLWVVVGSPGTELEFAL